MQYLFRSAENRTHFHHGITDGHHLNFFTSVSWSNQFSVIFSSPQDEAVTLATGGEINNSISTDMVVRPHHTTPYHTIPYHTIQSFHHWSVCSSLVYFIICYNSISTGAHGGLAHIVHCTG